MAWLVATVMMTGNAYSWCGQGYVVKDQLLPQNRITLHDDGVVTAIASVQLPAGTWDVVGGATVEFSCFDAHGNWIPFDYGWFSYAFVDVSTDPHHMADDSIRAIDARCRGTSWFPLQPVKRVFCGPITVYLVVATYGQKPADLTQVFGGMIANRFH